ncbi:StbB family protein [Paraburkholderia sediminicola]|uniref:StbB family protein n=1 Tax=Paraburkholderia sediminicola TaxID=458836 RepID=UPI0038BB3D1D
MKVATINFSGNQGKTTTAINMLSPRMPGAPVFSIESLNVHAIADGVDVEKMKGKRYGDLLDQLMAIDTAIIDVGASNAEDFLKMMRQFSGSHEEFDLFLVPTVKAKKQQADTLNTIRALAMIGIPKKKIRLIFNKVELDDNIEEDFAALFDLAEREKNFTLSSGAVIFENEVFDRLRTLGKSIREIAADQTDYRSLAREENDDEKKSYYRRMMAAKMLATTANKNLDDVFHEVMR